MPCKDAIGCGRGDHASLVDGIHSPPLGEGRTDLLLGHPSRTKLTWLTIAETKQKDMAAGRNGFSEALDVTNAPFVVEDMKETRVDHGVELLAHGWEVEGITHEKPDAETTSAGLVSRDGDGLGGGI